MTPDAQPLVTEPENSVDWNSHMIVVGALAWCIGYLESLGHDVSDRPFIKAAMEPRLVSGSLDRRQ